ncbi:hypothetical protein FH608_048005 [Nonomuraea phyllanthi]|uniref:Uncharacterized protein n=1 Tax=Nonomuraea phyllanthi TaxID=2219224 RepID=A0A5C4V2G8_9ACTN|nr:hypothetical protein [Nonomuraea phyllanthi]KAB8184722.1 hypothetical protein FH608_048005 [Nonomuraea phyllanthi]
MTNQTSGGFLGDLDEAFTPPAAGGCCGSPSSASEPSGVAGQAVTEPAAAATACCGSPAAAEQAAQSGCCGQAPAPVGSQAGSQASVQGGSGCCG